MHTMHATASSGVSGTKRKTPDDGVQLRQCLQCLQSYSEKENSYTACSYHNGYLEVDKQSYLWTAHCEGRLQGGIDTEEMREQHPSAFRWSCCDEIGYSHGCTRGRHFPVNVRRGRYYENGRVPMGRRILPVRRSVSPAAFPASGSSSSSTISTLHSSSTSGPFLTPPATASPMITSAEQPSEHQHEHENKKLKPRWCF